MFTPPPSLSPSTGGIGETPARDTVVGLRARPCTAERCGLSPALAEEARQSPSARWAPRRGFRVQGSRVRGQGSGVRASGSGVRGRGFGFRVHPRGGNTPGGHPGAIVRHLSPSHRSKEHGTACVPVNPPHSVPSCVLSTRAIPSRERKNEANTALTSRDASRGRNVFITSC